MKHIARKRFGQHFLSDGAIIDAIVRAIAPQPGQAMVEIGPGLAALTQPLVERLGHLCVIEIDRDLAQRLREHPQLTVLHGDVLRVDFRRVRSQWGMQWDMESGMESGMESDIDAHPRTDALATRAVPDGPDVPDARDTPKAAPAHAGKLRIVGNLPYNISTPILFHLLDHVDAVEDQHFMLQKEVVDRMVAAPACAGYGRLSVMLQWRYAMERVLCVPPESFVPAPRVDSAVVRMVPLAHPPAVERTLLSELVQVAFSQRRKLLRHTLEPWLARQGFAGPFDAQRRAEEVPVHEYVGLAQRLAPRHAQNQGPAHGAHD